MAAAARCSGGGSVGSVGAIHPVELTHHPQHRRERWPNRGTKWNWTRSCWAHPQSVRSAPELPPSHLGAAGHGAVAPVFSSAKGPPAAEIGAEAGENRTAESRRQGGSGRYVPPDLIALARRAARTVGPADHRAGAGGTTTFPCGAAATSPWAPHAAGP